ncbi:MAG: hypothetical protein WCG10_02045, partial [Chlamydiota bacterium]
MSYILICFFFVLSVFSPLNSLRANNAYIVGEVDQQAVAWAIPLNNPYLGKKTLLLDPLISTAEDIALSSTTAYIVGRINGDPDDPTIFYPSLWSVSLQDFTLAASPIQLTSYNSYGINSVAISSNTAYMDGTTQGGGAILWTTPLSNLSNVTLAIGPLSEQYFSKIALSTTNVYIIGDKDNAPTYATLWISPLSNPSNVSAPISLSNPDSHANSVALSTQNIYVVGFDGLENATLWIRSLSDPSSPGSTITLDNSGNSFAYSIALSTQNIYVVGFDGLGNATLWIRSLSDPSSPGST